MVQEYEDNIFPPPLEFGDGYKPIPKPRIKKMTVDKPVRTTRAKIEQTSKALIGYTKSFETGVSDNKDLLRQLMDTGKTIQIHLMKQVDKMKGLKFIETLSVTFEKYTEDSIIITTIFFKNKIKTVINTKDIDEDLLISIQEIQNKIDTWISEGFSWTIKSMDSHYINIVRYNPLKGSSYIQLPSELRNSAIGLFNLKNNDNECFGWCHIRHLHPRENYTQRIEESNKRYAQKLDCSGIEFLVSVKQYTRNEKFKIFMLMYLGMKKETIPNLFIKRIIQR